MKFIFKFLFIYLQIILTSYSGTNESFEAITTVSYPKWEFFYENDGIKLYRGQGQKQGILPFRAEGIIKGASLNRVVNMILDEDNRPKWAPKLESITLIKKFSPTKFLYKEHYRTPWPALDREFILVGEVIILSPEEVLFKAHTTPDAEKYRHPKRINARVDYLDLHLTSLSVDQTKIIFTFLGDMGGWIPTWLINLIQKKWPLKFIKNMQNEVQHPARPWTKHYLEIFPQR